MACENEKECSCPKTTCENHSKCCDCVIKHKLNGGLPHYLREVVRCYNEKE